jgi:hypothetical protein
MVLLHHPSQGFRFRQRRGFTLVELITAASLMTLMMMGVVQIFAIVTETASQAQGSAYAMEQGRALLDSIHRDIRGFDRLGYFKIQKSDTNDAGAPITATLPSLPTQRPALGAPVFALNPITWYSTDCLALTSVGFWEGQMGSSTPRRYTGAEVVYSANVKTPTTRFQVQAGTGSALTVDPRRGLIGRGVWLLTGTDQTAGGSDSDDRSRAAVMAGLVSAGKKRLDLTDSKDTSNTLAVPKLSIQPMTSFGVSSSPWQFRRVAASCASEFLVEALDISTTGTPNWPLPRTTAWTTNPIVSGDTATSPECPRAIRVTVAIHDPSDKKPSTGPSGRYEGYALQEVFWISDP